MMFCLSKAVLVSPSVMIVLSSVCWMKSRGVVPNTKVLNSESKFSVLNSEEQIDYVKESNS